MIPLRDVIPSRTTPYVTIAIIALNALAWFFEISMPREDLSVFLQVWGIVPAAFIPTTLLTAMFLHGGLFHLVGNMLFLFVFGNNVEDRLGRVRYLLFYLACGYLATYGFALADPTSEQTLVGASGAIAWSTFALPALFCT